MTTAAFLMKANEVAKQLGGSVKNIYMGMGMDVNCEKARWIDHAAVICIFGERGRITEYKILYNFSKTMKQEVDWCTFTDCREDEVCKRAQQLVY